MALFGSSDDDLQRRVEELERRVAALERGAHHGGWTPSRPPIGEPSESWASDDVRRLAMQGNKIAAIKLLREETGLGLKEAKDIVDRL
jgi:ribosomal protein L7/L12